MSILDELWCGNVEPAKYDISSSIVDYIIEECLNQFQVWKQ